jgi:hypothetical protein
LIPWPNNCIIRSSLRKEEEDDEMIFIHRSRDGEYS